MLTLFVQSLNSRLRSLSPCRQNDQHIFRQSTIGEAEKGRKIEPDQASVRSVLPFSQRWEDLVVCLVVWGGPRLPSRGSRHSHAATTGKYCYCFNLCQTLWFCLSSLSVGHQHLLHGHWQSVLRLREGIGRPAERVFGCAPRSQRRGWPRVSWSHLRFHGRLDAEGQLCDAVQGR